MQSEIQGGQKKFIDCHELRLKLPCITIISSQNFPKFNSRVEIWNLRVFSCQVHQLKPVEAGWDVFFLSKIATAEISEKDLQHKIFKKNQNKEKCLYF